MDIALEDSAYPVPKEYIEFSKMFAKNMTPKTRTAGWKELETEIRGRGDFYDLLGSLFVFNQIASQNRICRMDITAGIGDKSDIDVRINNEFKSINVKTSSYTPYREGLSLFIKEEELIKPMDAFVQCFFHPNEGNYEPHIHVAGWITTNSATWKECAKNIITLPNTGGHKGVRIPASKLQPLDKMISLVDSR